MKGSGGCHALAMVSNDRRCGRMAYGKADARSWIRSGRRPRRRNPWGTHRRLSLSLPGYHFFRADWFACVGYGRSDCASMAHPANKMIE